METDFKGYINQETGRKFPPLPKEKIGDKERFNEWNEKIFKNTQGVLVKKSNYKILQLFTILFFMGLLFIGLLFIYYVSKDKLKNEINQPINLENNITTQNNYTFSNPTTNSFDNHFNNTFYNNYTINVNCPTLQPTLICNCSQ